MFSGDRCQIGYALVDGYRIAGHSGSVHNTTIDDCKVKCKADNAPQCSAMSAGQFESNCSYSFEYPLPFGSGFVKLVPDKERFTMMRLQLCLPGTYCLP